MNFALMTATDLGSAIRQNRLALGKTQAELAVIVGCRRQTIGDLEAGRNVAMYTLLDVLCALGKGLHVVDSRPDIDHLDTLFNHDE